MEEVDDGRVTFSNGPLLVGPALEPNDFFVKDYFFLGGGGGIERRKELGRGKRNKKEKTTQTLVHPSSRLPISRPTKQNALNTKDNVSELIDGENNFI